MPDWKQEVRERLASLKLSPVRESEIVEEVAQDLDDCYHELLSSGTSETEARRRTLAELSGHGLLARELRRLEKPVTAEPVYSGTRRRFDVIADLWQDLRYAVRRLRKQPAFTAVAVLTLALGIGANTAIFSVVYAVVLKPLPFQDPERLVAIWTRTPQVERLPMAAANHRDLQSQGTVFEDIAIVRATANFNVTGDGEPERLQASGIPANLLPLLGVKPMIGRNFTADESEPGRNRSVILSYELWRRRHAGDENVLGKEIRLDNVAFTVVGIMGPEFHYPTAETQIWTPLTVNPADYQTRTGFGHLAVARLKPGVTAEQAQTEASVIAARLAQQYPDKNGDVRFTVTPLRQDIANVARMPLFVLLGASLGMLLIGCCNLVNLLLAQAMTRNRENAVRTALGSTPARLARQVALELFPVLLLGSVSGVLAARVFISLILPLLPPALPRGEEIAINVPVLLFSAALLLIAAILLVMVPALQARRLDLTPTLREDSRTSAGTAIKATLRSSLIVGQVALTVVLLAGSGLLIRTFAALKDVDPGFRPQGVLSLRLAIPNNKYRGDEQVAAFCQRILERVRALPGVEIAGMSNRLPLGGPTGLSTIEFERVGQEPGSIAATDDTTVTPDYFRAMGIPLIQGRSFTEQDTVNAPLVVMLDEQVAQRAWPGENPIGKRVRSGPTSPWAEVVGVVGHVRHESLDTDRRWQIYWNYLQRARDRISLVVRTSGDPHLLVNPVVGAIKSLDADQPAFAILTMAELVNQSIALRWFNAVVVGFFAGTSLLLAVIGIYGMMAWTVRQRTRQIGIRLALGAQANDVLRLILGEGARLTLIGLGIGVVAAVGLTRLLKSLLFGVSATDPITFGGMIVLLALAAFLACWIPARRALRVDPLITLKSE